MRFRPRVFALASAPDAGEILSRLRSRRALAALDSAGGSPRRFSVVGFDPLEGLAPPGTIAEVRSLLAGLAPEAGDEVPGPFHGGFLGALAYDLGVARERRGNVPPDPWRSPRIAGGLYVDFVVRDDERGIAWLVLGDDPGDGRPGLAQRRGAILALLERARSGAATKPAGPLVRRTPAEVHRARIQSARERIAAGDFYQANLAHRFTRPVDGDPVDIYRRLRVTNPAPYAGFLAWDAENASAAADFPRGALLSSSPELLLDYDGELARTRPIKGTAPRGATPEDDARAARALLASAKDRAELAMIVDLERNDLGSVARPGSVRVEGFPRLETYASVHHLVADVVARPRAGADAFDLLAALFPGGSVTGAPKLAAMRAIGVLEGEGRGFFTGSMGFVDCRGRACWNILIRTLVWRPGEVSFHVGGGITWPSDPEAEDQETIAKAAGLAEALEAPSRPRKKTGPRASTARSPGDRTRPTL